MPTHYRGGALKSVYLERSRNLRQESTDAERRLWQRLRAGHLGVKFRRQHEFGRYILDFYSAECGLGIEIDGGQHFTDEGAARDAARTRYLNSHGVRILQFTNLEVLQEMDAVLLAILKKLEERSPHPGPLPRREGESDGT